MPARPDRRELGDAAEDAARHLLEGEGLRTLARNVNYRFGEIDLVMRDGEITVFVEVRYRSSLCFGGAAASVTHHKCYKIALAARAWLAARPALAGGPCRFDIVAASGGKDGLQLQWIQNAFDLQDCGL